MAVQSHDTLVYFRYSVRVFLSSYNLPTYASTCIDLNNIMPRGPEIDPQTRSRICELKLAGWKYTHIMARFPDIPLSTLKTTVNREKDRENNVSKPRSGAPKKLTEEDAECIRARIRADPHSKYDDLLAEVNWKVKRRSIQRLLGLENMRKWRQRKRPYIEDYHAIQRLIWARRYEHFTTEDWAKVLWSDECSVERGAGLRPRWTFNSLREQLAQKDVKQVHTGKGIRQMFWAAFGEETRTDLLTLNGDPNSPRGGVNAIRIRELYAEVLPQILTESSIFMHDNAPVHTARIVRELLQELGVEVMVWPPYSPDLNPIENLWALMKHEIYQLYPHLEHAPDNQDTLDNLILAAKEAWDNIRPQVLVKLSTTMPHRVVAVIEADGWYTKY